MSRPFIVLHYLFGQIMEGARDSVLVAAWRAAAALCRHTARTERPACIGTKYVLPDTPYDHFGFRIGGVRLVAVHYIAEVCRESLAMVRQICYNRRWTRLAHKSNNYAKRSPCCAIGLPVPKRKFSSAILMSRCLRTFQKTKS